MSTFEFDDRIGGRLRGTLHVPGATPGDVVTVGANGALSPAPGGGSQPYTVRIARFPFAFDTPGLADGVAAYSPPPDTLLLDAAIRTSVAWANGTTPLADVGYLQTGSPEVSGFFASLVAGAAIDMTQAEEDSGFGDGGDFFVPPFTNWSLLGATIAAMLVNSGAVFSTWQGRFATATPLMVWVSQDGNAGGADPGADAGTAILELTVAEPA